MPVAGGSLIEHGANSRFDRRARGRGFGHLDVDAEAVRRLRRTRRARFPTCLIHLDAVFLQRPGLLPQPPGESRRVYPYWGLAVAEGGAILKYQRVRASYDRLS